MEDYNKYTYMYGIILSIIIGVIVVLIVNNFFDVPRTIIVYKEKNIRNIDNNSIELHKTRELPETATISELNRSKLHYIYDNKHNGHNKYNHRDKLFDFKKSPSHLHH